MVISSFIKTTRIGNSAPSSSNQSLWYTCFIRSTIAFFIIDCISEGLNNLLFIEVAFATQNFPFNGIYFSHGIFLVFSNNSSKVVALNLATLSKIRSVVLRKILARHIASISPEKVTFPSSTCTISYPKSKISLFNTASSPK